MKKVNLCYGFVWLFILFFVFSVSLLGQVDEKPLQLDLHHDVDVTLKLIQVYVFDKNGNPVTDLELSDFVLFDNGKEQILTEFEKHILKRPERITEIEATALPAPSASRMNRKFFLLFDFAFNSLAGVQRSKNAALHFLDTQLLPNDEVGLLTYSCVGGLTLHSYFTRDVKRIRGIVEGFDSNEVFKGTVDGRGKKWEELAGASFPGVGGKGVNGLIPAVEEAERYIAARDFNRRIYKRQTLDFASHMKQLALALRYIPGYKHVVLFSGGILNFMGNEREVRSELENMVEELDASSSPVYSVNVAGTGTRSNEPVPYRSDHSLRDISMLTGGKYYENTGNVEEIMEDIQNLTSAYYVLGYYIDEKWDGKRHSIKVRVNERGLDVFAQKGFFNPKPFKKYTKYEKMLHLIDLAVGENPYFQTPLSFSLSTLPFYEEGKSYLLLLSEIPHGSLKKDLGDKLEIVSLVLDRESSLIELRKSDVNLARLKKDLYYYTVFPLLPGSYSCRIVVRDLKTGAGALAASRLIEIQKPDSDLIITNPLLLTPVEEGFLLKAVDQEDPLYDFSLNDILLLQTEDYIPFSDEISRESEDILVLTHCRMKDKNGDTFSLSFKLENRHTGISTPVNWVTEKERVVGSLHVFLHRISFNPLPAGEYLLRVSAGLDQSGEDQVGITRFLVK